MNKNYINPIKLIIAIFVIVVLVIVKIFVSSCRESVCIKPIPSFWNYTIFLDTKTATTIYPNIYLPEEMYSHYISGELSITESSVLLHERTHIERQGSYGPIKWLFNYIFSRKFRLNEELFAIRKQMEFLALNGEDYDINKKASQFSSSTYLWVTTKEKAEKLLTQMWDDVVD